MNKTEAIQILECMAIDITGAMGGLRKTNPMADVLRQRIDAINRAQQALRSEAEREKGCAFCNKERHHIREAFDEGTAQIIDAGKRYALSIDTSRDAAIFNIFCCPMCGCDLGKRLEVEP